MSGYRSDHEALLARIANLEEELAQRDAQGIAGLRKRLEELRAADPVDEQALLALQTDAREARRAVREIITAADKLAGAPPPTRPTTPWMTRGRGALVALVALVAIGMGAFFLVTGTTNGGRELCKGKLDALMLERLRGRDCDPNLLVDATALADGPHRVVPTSLIDVTRKQYNAPGEPLRGIEIPQVRSSGLVDFRDPSYWGVVSVHLASHGGVFDFEGMHPGFSDFQGALGASPFVPEPHCSVAQVWEGAIAAGADRNQLASVTYKFLNDRPRWIFEAGGQRLVIDDATCRVSPK